MHFGRTDVRMGTGFGARANCVNLSEQQVVLRVAPYANADRANMNSIEIRDQASICCRRGFGRRQHAGADHQVRADTPRGDCVFGARRVLLKLRGSTLSVGVGVGVGFGG